MQTDKHQIEDIEKVITPIRNKEADIIIGSRFLDSAEDEIPDYRKFGIRLLLQKLQTHH